MTSTATQRPQLDLPNNESIDDVVYIPGHKLIAITLDEDNYVRIFREDGGKRAERVFKNHSRKNTENEVHIYGIVHLYDDIMCSLDSTGTVLVWLASNCEVLSSHTVRNPKSMTKLSPTEVVIVREGEILVLCYNDDTESLDVRLRIKEPHAKRIVVAEAHVDILVTGYEEENYKAKIWDLTTGNLLHTLQLDEEPYDIAISRRFIVFSGDPEGDMRVFDRNFKYKQVQTDVDLEAKEEADLNFIDPNNSNLLLITTSELLAFVSLPSGEVVAEFKPEFAGVNTPQYKAASVLEDGRLCVTADNNLFGLCLAPAQVLKQMKKKMMIEADKKDDSDIGTAKQQEKRIPVGESRKRSRGDSNEEEPRVQKARVANVEVKKGTEPSAMETDNNSIDDGTDTVELGESVLKRLQVKETEWMAMKKKFEETEKELRKREVQEEKLKAQLADVRKTIKAERDERQKFQKERKTMQAVRDEHRSIQEKLKTMQAERDDRQSIDAKLEEERKTMQAERDERESIQEELNSERAIADILRKQLETSRHETKSLLQEKKENQEKINMNRPTNGPKSLFARMFGWGT